MIQTTRLDISTVQTTAKPLIAWRRIQSWRERAIRGTLLLGFLLPCLLCTSVRATDVSGPIVNQTWTSNNSPYRVVGDILVASLTINPAVTVLFTSNYVFEVQGRLKANGAAVAPIVFMGTNGGWQGIYFNHSLPGLFLAYCTVSNSVNSGIRIEDSTPAIANCVIVNNSGVNGGGIYSSSVAKGGLVLQNCLVTNNTASGQGGGIYANMAVGDLLVQNSSVFSNASASSGGGVRVILGTNTLRMDGCLLSGNVVNPTISVGDGSWFAGGGICVSGSSLLKNCVVLNNMCYSKTGSPVGSGVSLGGAMYSETGGSDLRNCIISGNQAQAIHGTGGDSWAAGGGIYIYSAR